MSCCCLKSQDSLKLTWVQTCVGIGSKAVEMIPLRSGGHGLCLALPCLLVSTTSSGWLPGWLQYLAQSKGKSWAWTATSGHHAEQGMDVTCVITDTGQVIPEGGKDWAVLESRRGCPWTVEVDVVLIILTLLCISPQCLLLSALIFPTFCSESLHLGLSWESWADPRVGRWTSLTYELRAE